MSFDRIKYAKWLVKEYGLEKEVYGEKDKFAGNSSVLCFDGLKIIYLQSEKSEDFDIFYYGGVVYREITLNGNSNIATYNS